MKALKMFGVLLTVVLTVQSFAGELGRPSSSGSSTSEQFKWINGLCFDLQVSSAGVIEDVNKAIEICPNLRDYSQVTASYAERKSFSVPPHQPGTICKTKSFWTWAIMVGPVGDACRAPKADGTFVNGTLI
jgi:hypothetical protein